MRIRDLTMYSLAEIVRLSNARPRSVQLWADAEAILANPSTEKRGTGIHRRFNRDEAIIACCLSGFARRQVGIGELKRIGKAIRLLLKEPFIKDLINEVVETDHSWDLYLAVIWPEESDGDPVAKVLDEADLSPTLGEHVRGRGCCVLLPLTAHLLRLRSHQN